MKIRNILAILILFLVISSCTKKEELYLAYFKQGEIYLNNKNNLKAIEYFDKAITENSEYLMSYQYRAMTYLELRKYNKAEEDLNLVISKYENENEKISAYYLMFILYARQSKFDNAYQYLDKSLSLSNGNTIKRFFYGDKTTLSKHFLQIYGTNLIKEGNIKKAHTLFSKSIKYFPDEYFGYFGLAYIEKNYYKNYQKADKYLQKGRKIGKDKINLDKNLNLNVITDSIITNDINK